MADDIEDIPKELFLKLMETSIKAAHDNNKVKLSYKLSSTFMN
jgi:hypothetical protein